MNRIKICQTKNISWYYIFYIDVLCDVISTTTVVADISELLIGHTMLSIHNHHFIFIFIKRAR